MNYNPEMAQWEGDGELVGVRTKMLFTASESISTVPEYQSSYFTEVKKRGGGGEESDATFDTKHNI